MTQPLHEQALLLWLKCFTIQNPKGQTSDLQQLLLNPLDEQNKHYEHLKYYGCSSISPRADYTYVTIRNLFELIFNSLTQSHLCSPTLTYHNLNHVIFCLQELQTYQNTEPNPYFQELQLALWFHDFVYEPFAKDNEEQSAQKAYYYLSQLSILESSLNLIYQLILNTKHQTPATTLEGQIIQDVDLSILGQEPKIFDRYRKQIRREYPGIPPHLYNPERIKVLKRFLGREKIFQTEYFYKKYEAQARNNLNQAIKMLG